MQYLTVFPDMTKIVDFCWNIADDNGAQRLCHVIYIFIESSLSKVELCQVSTLWDMRDWF